MADLPAQHHRHWHYVYRKRRQKVLPTNTRQMAITQVFSLIGSVVAGVLLENNKATLALIAGTFVVLPGVFDLVGTMGAVLNAKINHRLETTNQNPFRVFISTGVYTLLVAIAAGLLLSAAGAAIATQFFDGNFWQVFWLAELAVILSALIGFPVVGGMCLFFIWRKVNPDDVVGPIESSIFDILTVVTLTVVVGWLL